MIIPVHILFDLTVYFGIEQFASLNTSGVDLLFLLSAELIDLDHLFSKPIYHPRKNPFKTHFLHKRWMIIAVASIILMFFRPTLFLGIGLLSHLFIDYLYIKIFKLKN